METKRKVKKNANKKAMGQTVMSNLVCPEGMKLEDWQIQLRVKEAEKQPMHIEIVDAASMPGEFLVTSNSHLYKVVFHGKDSEWNYCDCMDFKTNRLGTCKHLEAVKSFLKEKRKPQSYRLPTYSSIYLSYRQDRCVKIRIGETNHEAMSKLADTFFCADGTLRKNKEKQIEKFIAKAKELDPDFRIYPDAMDFIIERRERITREKILERYDDKTLNHLLSVPLFPYQREGVRFSFAHGKSIIADEMGLGKTIQAIATAEMLRKEGFIESALIICPTSLKYQWKKEIERFTRSSAIVVEGDHLNRTRAYNHEATYKIVSYHSIANDLKVYKSMECDMIIMDEVQRLKNWNTQISKAARLIHSKYAVVLSGTPLENKLEELYSVMQFVDQFCLGPLYRFREESIVTDATGKTIGYKNLHHIGELASSALIRRTKKQVELQMPKRTDKILYVELTPQQREIHDETQSIVARIIERWRRMHFISENDRKKLLLCLNRMRMVCDSTFIIDQRTNYQTKIDEALNIIHTMMECGDEKMVVFSQWERMGRLLSNELEKSNIQHEFLHGGVPSQKRHELMDHFANDPSSRVFISTDAGATGLNLQSGSMMINLDLPWNPAVLEQRIARIYRIGQERPIQVINMVAHGTIEERMLTTLNFKSGMFAGILDDGEDAIFLENSKFDKILNTFADVIEANPDESPEKQERAKQVQEEVTEQAPTTSKAEEVPPAKSVSKPQEETIASANEVINQGMSFFKGLSEILSDQKRTEEFVNTIVREDKETGETAIHIPVSDKETVTKIFSVIGKLFNQG